MDIWATHHHKRRDRRGNPVADVGVERRVKLENLRAAPHAVDGGVKCAARFDAATRPPKHMARGRARVRACIPDTLPYVAIRMRMDTYAHKVTKYPISVRITPAIL